MRCVPFEDAVAELARIVRNPEELADTTDRLLSGEEVELPGGGRAVPDVESLEVCFEEDGEVRTSGLRGLLPRW